MKKLIIILLSLSLIIVIFLFTRNSENNPGNEHKINSSEEAINLVKVTYPKYKDYPSENLPITKIESVENEDGWRIGMYIVGSGVEGIIKADCFLVAKNGDINNIGFFQGEGPAKSINLYTCTPKE